MAPTHPYLAVARGNAYRWRLQRIAARFNYNPYFPQLAAYTPHRMPFADAERYAQRSLMGPYARSAYGYQLAELASEYEYFGLADVVEDLGHR